MKYPIAIIKKALTTLIIFALIAQAAVFAAAESRADYEFTLSFVESTKYISTNIERDTVVAKLENTGSKDDVYTVDVSQIPQNWRITFDNDETLKEYSVLAGSSQDVILIIDPPDSGEAYIKLKAKSKNSGTENTAFITLIVKEPIIKMSLEKSSKTILPDETALFSLNLSNLQEVPENVTISLTGSDITPSDSPKTDQWTYRLVDQSLIIELASNFSVVIVIEIDSPSETVANQIGVFRLKAVPESDDENFVETTLTVIVEELDSVTGTPNPRVLTGSAGDNVEFSLTLYNNGTSDLTDVSLFKGTLPPGWEFIYNSSMKYAIDRFASKTVKLSVSIPSFATVGSYKLQMGIYAKFKEVGNFSVMVSVSQNFDVDLSLTTTDERQVIDMKLESDVRFILKNTGNGHDTYILNLTKVPASWNIYFKSIEPVPGPGVLNKTMDFSKTLDLSAMIAAGENYITDKVKMVDSIRVLLGSRETVAVTLVVITGYSSSAEHNFTVNAYSSNKSTIGSLPLKLELIMSDLEITELTPSKVVPREDEDVFITVKITNRYHLAARNVSVVLIISDKVMEQKILTEISANETTSLEFKWTPTKMGLYTIEVRLQGNTVTDTDRTVYNRNLTVEEKAGEIKNNNGDSSAIYLVITVIIVLTVLAIVFLYISRERVRKLSEKRNNELKKRNGNGNGAIKRGVLTEKKREWDSAPQLKTKKPPKQLPPKRDRK